MPAYLVKSPVCTETMYFCGKETLAVAASGSETIKKGGKSGTTYILGHSDLDALFSLSTSAADAYSGCTISTYDLV